MSLIQDFEKLHITVKTSALTILSQMPFFFVAIYLFNEKLIKKIGNNPFYDVDFFFLISLCFCLSLTWFSMNLILTFIVFELGDLLENDTTKIDDIFKSSVIYSIGYLSVAIAINFQIKMSFFYFLLLAYSFIIFRMLYVGSFWIYHYFKK